MSEETETTWSNKPGDPDEQPLTIEALAELMKSLPGPSAPSPSPPPRSVAPAPLAAVSACP